jgi:hypothetical protein
MSTLPQLRLTIAQFETGEFDPERFDHEAHVYVAWWRFVASTLP